MNGCAAHLTKELSMYLPCKTIDLTSDLLWPQLVFQGLTQVQNIKFKSMLS